MEVISFFFFNQINQINLFCKLIQTNICSNLPNLLILLNERILSLIRNFDLATFDKSLTVFSNNVKHLIFFIALRCCIHHMIKQNCLLKFFPWTLILVNQVFSYRSSLLEPFWNYTLKIKEVFYTICKRNTWKLSVISYRV